MAASAMALLAGCPVGAVRDSLREFPGLEHRLEFVRELNGVSYFNDSKGTNVGAVIKSLESFSTSDHSHCRRKGQSRRLLHLEGFSKRKS